MSSMYSSHAKSPSRRSQAGACPRCGSLRVRMVTEAVVLKIRGTSYRFEDVPHERCTACGERVFGIDASRMFDGIVRGNRRTRAA